MVVAGAAHLNRQVRWVHVSELGDISRLLRGGELLLTTGIALDLSPASLRGYVDSLAQRGLSGLVVEAGQRLDRAPQAMVEAAERADLPLVVLQHEVRFVEVTEQAHSFIINSQATELRFRQEVHEALYEMVLEGTSTEDIVRFAAQAARRPVLLANRAGMVLHVASGLVATGHLLEEWDGDGVSLQSAGTARVVRGGRSWLVTPVGARGQVLGVLGMREPGGATSERGRIVLERAAAAIALNRLAERDRLGLELQAQRSLLDDILRGAARGDLADRAAALGFPVRAARFVGGEVRWTLTDLLAPGPAAEGRARDLAQLVTRAAARSGDRILTASRPEGAVQILLSSTRGGRLDVRLADLAKAIHSEAAAGDGAEVTLAFGTEVSELKHALWSVREAGQVLDALNGRGAKLYYRIPDVRLRGLLHLLRDDERVAAFAERELKPLLEADRREGLGLVRILCEFLAHRGNKVETAAALGISRPTLYARLARVEALLQVKLTDGEALASLQVAIMAREMTRRARDLAAS